MDGENVLPVDDFVSSFATQNYQSKVRIGRKSINDAAMSDAERSKRKRAKAAGRIKSFHTTNASAIAAASTLYVRDGALVVDATWGRGQFWRKTNADRFILIGSDLVTKAKVRADFRQLPYADEALDVVVLDPPYVWNGHPRMTNHDRFGGGTAPETIDEILELYRAGMTEARRVLKPRGRLFVKMMDQMVNRRQYWFSVDLPGIAKDLGMFMRDRFEIKANKTPSYPQWQEQFHASKSHSFLLIFERKPGS